MNNITSTKRTPNYQAPTLLPLEEALQVYARYLTDDHGFLWPDPFVLWAYKRNYRLMEVRDDEK